MIFFTKKYKKSGTCNLYRPTKKRQLCSTTNNALAKINNFNNISLLQTKIFSDAIKIIIKHKNHVVQQSSNVVDSKSSR